MKLRTLRRLEASLCAVAGALQQESNRKVRITVSLAAANVSAVAAVTGVTGAIGVLGVASTGTAIASLSGAAATSATLYWVGSLAGMGMAAGSLMLTGLAVIVALLAPWFVYRHIFGRPRGQHEMSDREQTILLTSVQLAAGLRATLNNGPVPTRGDMRTVAQTALVPLLAGIESLVAQGEIKPFLALLPRFRLHRAATMLRQLSQELGAP